MTDLPTVITFTTEGTAEFTRGDQPAHDMLDNMFARGDMQRVTDITMDPVTKRYMIQWLKGPYASSLSDMYVHGQLFGGAKTHHPIIIKSNVLTFDSYEHAVAYERECLVAMRKNGVIF